MTSHPRPRVGVAGFVSVRKNWLVTCWDVFGRKRRIVVFAEDDQVVMAAPPGETAALTPAEVGRLCAALRDAGAEAARNAAGRSTCPGS